MKTVDLLVLVDFIASYMPYLEITLYQLFIFECTTVDCSYLFSIDNQGSGCLGMARCFNVQCLDKTSSTME